MIGQGTDAFCDALRSNSSMLPEHAQIFSPFIGSWDLVVRWFDREGKVARKEDGEWHFSWVLEGRGVQDVWIVPPRAKRQTGALYEYGTSIRFYDPALDAWQSTWVGPMHGLVRTFSARRVEQEVVLETTPDVAPAMKWSFHDIQADAFEWKNEIREADTWRVQQTFEARRQVF